MTNTNDILKIDTPENVTFDYDVAGIGSRFLAALVDTALILILQGVVIGTLILLVTLFSDGDLFAGALSAWILAGLGLISFIFLWGYYIFFEILWNGQTPGKRWVGLRVIRVDGTPITASEAVIRNLVRIIDFLPTAYGVGVVTMFVNANSRRVGDFAAGTIVVHERETKGLGDLSPIRTNTLTIPGSQNHLPDGFPAERLSQYELQIIEEFLLRRSGLSNRSVLAQHILASIVTRLQLAPETIHYDKSEEILSAIYKAVNMDKPE
ncbi:MAG: RDD family protein [Chloroflexi bacterium]|nr:RDD family protein [Chloroflexota bacterium]